MRETPTYTTWRGMLERCRNPNGQAWEYYGARVISVCARWHTFANFLADMGQRPAGLSIDRINNDGNYEPGNCRWATASQQARNSRPWKRRTTPPKYPKWKKPKLPEAEKIRRSAARSIASFERYRLLLLTETWHA